jgi:hypothetical protein
MNRFLLFLSAISIGSISNLRAQNSMFDLGLEGGPNLSTVSITSPLFEANTKPTIFGSGGFIFQYNFKNFLSIKTGLSYQRKGFQFPESSLVSANGDFVGTGRTVYSLDYMTLPILVKASFGKKVQFFVNAGPYVGFLLGKTERVNITTNDSEQISKNKDMTGLNRWDFGVSGGIGIAIPIRTYWVISVEARNYTGLMDIAESNNVKWLTNTTDLRIGVAYKLGFYKDE